MKIVRCLAPAALFFSLQMANAQVYSGNIVGYVNRVFLPGYNLFANPLTYDPDTLSNLIPTAPNNAAISLWNPTTQTFSTASTFSSGHWSVNLTLSPGTGARLYTSIGFTNTFVGNVENHDGSMASSDQLLPAPVYTGPDGVFLLGDKAPMADTGTDIFLNILGRAPNPGEKVTLLDSATQTYTTSTYLGNNSWDTAPPALYVSGAAFLTVSSVPEPSGMAFAGLGVAMFGVVGRFVRKKPAKN